MYNISAPCDFYRHLDYCSCIPLMCTDHSTADDVMCVCDCVSCVIGDLGSRARNRSSLGRFLHRNQVLSTHAECLKYAGQWIRAGGLCNILAQEYTRMTSTHVNPLQANPSEHTIASSGILFVHSQYLINGYQYCSGQVCDDDLLHAFSFLSASDLATVLAVSHTWRHLAQSDFLWQPILLRAEFPIRTSNLESPWKGFVVGKSLSYIYSRYKTLVVPDVGTMMYTIYVPDFDDRWFL